MVAQQNYHTVSCNAHYTLCSMFICPHDEVSWHQECADKLILLWIFKEEYHEDFLFLIASNEIIAWLPLETVYIFECFKERWSYVYFRLQGLSTVSNSIESHLNMRTINIYL